MVIQNLIQAEGSSSLDHHCQRESKNQDMVFNSMAFLVSVPVHEKSEFPVNRNKRDAHDHCDAKGCDPA
jgi:hypothetical protein